MSTQLAELEQKASRLSAEERARFALSLIGHSTRRMKKTSKKRGALKPSGAGRKFRAARHDWLRAMKCLGMHDAGYEVQ